MKKPLITQEEFRALFDEAKVGMLLTQDGIDRVYELLTARLVPTKAEAGAQEFIARYCEVWKARYGSSPIIAGREAGLVKRLLKDMGKAQALTLIEAYLQMSDSFYVGRRHDLMTFSLNANAVKLWAEGHGSITKKELIDADKQEGSRAMWDRLRNKHGK